MKLGLVDKCFLTHIEKGETIVRLMTVEKVKQRLQPALKCPFCCNMKELVKIYQTFCSVAD